MHGDNICADLLVARAIGDMVLVSHALRSGAWVARMETILVTFFRCRRDTSRFEIVLQESVTLGL